MHYATIKWTDIANGEGVRISLFVSGCTHHCKNCFNPETWNFCYGKPFTKEVEDEVNSIQKEIEDEVKEFNESLKEELGVIKLDEE